MHTLSTVPGVYATLVAVISIILDVAQDTCLTRTAFALLPLRVWSEHQIRSLGKELTCPLCRADWGEFKWKPPPTRWVYQGGVQSKQLPGVV
jgi:hypothetical protein